MCESLSSNIFWENKVEYVVSGYVLPAGDVEKYLKLSKIIPSGSIMRLKICVYLDATMFCFILLIMCALVLRHCRI